MSKGGHEVVRETRLETRYTGPGMKPGWAFWLPNAPLTYPSPDQPPIPDLLDRLGCGPNLRGGNLGLIKTSRPCVGTLQRYDEPRPGSPKNQGL